MLRFVRPVFVLAVVALAAWAGVGLAGEGARAGGGCRGITSTEGSGNSVSMDDRLCFTPTVLHVEPGTRVMWTNDGNEPHSVAGATIEWGNYNEHRRGESVEYAFEQPGTYPYYCFVHNGMTGAIVVGDGKSGNAIPASERVMASPAAESPANAREAVPGVEPAVPTASLGDSTSESRDLTFAGLGALAGAVAVVVAFGARSIRNP